MGLRKRTCKHTVPLALRPISLVQIEGHRGESPMIPNDPTTSVPELNRIRKQIEEETGLKTRLAFAARVPSAQVARDYQTRAVKTDEGYLAIYTGYSDEGICAHPGCTEISHEILCPICDKAVAIYNHGELKPPPA